MLHCSLFPMFNRSYILVRVTVPELVALPEKHVQGAYGIWLYTEKHPIIKHIKKSVAPSVHGDKHWDSSYLLMDYFKQHHPAKKSRVLDVGCGWGPTSIYLARQGCRVTGMDVDADVFVFLQAQAELNRVHVATLHCAMKNMGKRELAHFDVIVGGDICFWDELTDEWLAMLKRAAQVGVKTAVLADPGRSPFFNLIRQCEKRWPTERIDWYALEPGYFSGNLVKITLNL